jgi:RNA 2',3'-cyclic 3'-phosphodiesterase
MHRLFIAIRPPAEIRNQLLSLMGGVSGARWQDDEQLHLTLRFVGEVDARVADDLADALGAVRFVPFHLLLSGLGRFERKGHVTALWAGVQPRDLVAQLHRKVDRACVRIGLPPDERAYLPHITLARLNRPTGPTDIFVSQHGGLSSSPFLIDRFALFESHLSPDGAYYRQAVSYHADGVGI